MVWWSKQEPVDERLRITYAEALRAINQQQEVLDNLRARIGVVLSAAGISTSFLVPLIRDSPNLVVTAGSIGVGVLFTAVVLLTIRTFMPRGFTFGIRPDQVTAKWIDGRDYSVNRFLRELTHRHSRQFESNQLTIKRIQRLYAWACRLFGLEVILLISVAIVEASMS